jgi:3-isopropylmalate/(R)-2-methylmalate dehydratase small subunit
MDAIRQLSSSTVVLPAVDIDTDQIIPARFLTTTSKEGLGDALFAEWRVGHHHAVPSTRVAGQAVHA